MANEQNLRTLSPEEAREQGRKGGQASGAARKQKKQLREAFLALMEQDITAKGGQVLSGADAIAMKVFEKALKGDLKAFELIRDTTGQKPTEQMHIYHDKDNSELAELIQSLKGGDDNAGRGEV